MAFHIRRVITGHDDAGRAVFVSDGTPPATVGGRGRDRRQRPVVDRRAPGGRGRQAATPRARRPRAAAGRLRLAPGAASRPAGGDPGRPGVAPCARRRRLGTGHAPHRHARLRDGARRAGGPRPRRRRPRTGGRRHRRAARHPAPMAGARRPALHLVGGHDPAPPRHPLSRRAAAAARHGEPERARPPAAGDRDGRLRRLLCRGGQRGARRVRFPRLHQRGHGRSVANRWCAERRRSGRRPGGGLGAEPPGRRGGVPAGGAARRPRPRLPGLAHDARRSIWC